MYRTAINDHLREACRIHARLLDSFIELTRAELEKLQPGFAEECLRDFLATMRADRKTYGTIAGLVPVENAA